MQPNSTPDTGGKPESRFKKIRRARIEAQQDGIDDAVNVHLEKNRKDYRDREALERDLRRAEVRKRVSEHMYLEDTNIAPSQKRAIEDRQIHRHFDYAIKNPQIHGHAEALHGAQPSELIKKFHDEQLLSGNEPGTSEIARLVGNHTIAKKPRTVTDINLLSTTGGPEIMTEGRKVLAKEYNLNAIKAQRDLQERIFASMLVTNEQGKLQVPYMAISIHGKTDLRGHDFEIAAAPKGKKYPLTPGLAFWFAERLEKKIAHYDLRGKDGNQAAVNVVTTSGAYCGSPALTRMRYGDVLFNHAGFGDLFQALQLEIGRKLRDTEQIKIAKILDEILEEFGNEFPNAEALKKLHRYDEQVAAKVAQENNERFSKQKIYFDDSVPQRSIGLSESLREALDVSLGDTVIVAGESLTVTKMKIEVMKRNHATMQLHTSFQQKIGPQIEITTIERTEQ